MEKKILYFAPHQDDELLNFGLDIANETEKNKDSVYVYLCTDGSSSGVRKALNNQQTCTLHEGIHNFELSREEFSKARDREFMLSLEALGVKKENIHIFENRAVDGSLKPNEAENFIIEAVKSFPPGTYISVHTIAPYRKKPQQTDHEYLGLAAMKLFDENIINEYKLIVENPDLEFKSCDFPEIEFIKEGFTNVGKEKVVKASKAYKIWEPEKGFYAIGYHSVYDEFVNYLTFPDSYSIIKSK